MNLLLQVTALTPRQLDYCIAKARGRAWPAQQVIDNQDYYYRPSSDWHYCGPLLDELQYLDQAFVDLDLKVLDFPVKIAICQLWLQASAGYALSIPFSLLTKEQTTEIAKSLVLS